MLTPETLSLDEALVEARAGTPIVTAGRRLARVLRERADRSATEQGREVWTAPKIVPWTAWLGELWEAALYAGAPMPVRISADAAELVWERVILMAPEAESLLEISATAEAAAEAWDLMQAWRIDQPALETHATEDTRAFLAWAREFECASAREGWIDGARVADFLVPRLAELPVPPRIVLAGFDEVTPQQADFLDACRKAGAEVCFAESRACALAPWQVRAGFPDRTQELTAAARWARALVERGETGIAVVVRGLDRVRPQVERIFSTVLAPESSLPGSDARGVPFNLSVGPALASYPLIHTALLALELAPDRNDLRLVSRVLRAPFLAGADSEWTLRGVVDAQLRRTRAAEVPISQVQRVCGRYGCDGFAATLDGWRRERQALPARQRPAAWARVFSSLLERLGWPGERSLTSREYQACNAWRELLSEFAALETVAAEMSFGEALRRLRKMAASRMFQPESGAAPVQILGMLETAGLQFDHLWIAGLDDESWPGPPKPAAFLPPALQRARQLPHASPERELAFSRAVTDRLLASARNVVVSYTEQEEDRELAPSPLIRHIAPGTPEGVEVPDYLTVVQRSGEWEALDDQTGPPVEGDVSGGTRIFQDQAACPFRAFAEIRLGAKPLETPEPGLSAADRGLLVHMALETTWGELKTHARLQALAGELQPLVHVAVLRALDALGDYRGSPLPPRFAALEQRRVEARVLEWLALEQRRAPFEVVQPEGERYAEIGGVRVRVKLDRVDRLPDGREVILDYKTGRIGSHCWEGDRPDEPQLPLYAVTHEAQLAGVVFGKLRAGEIGFRGCQEGAGIPSAEEVEFEAKLPEWRRVLERLAADFRNGVAAVDPKHPATCRHCELSSLCRISEAEISTSALEGEDSDD